ncbi:MAG: hypothetical protein KDH09_03035 [Chrysiogenetes bacterium]|nr:hypothetical protein [Chrysiogenetes bacterium]
METAPKLHSAEDETLAKIIESLGGRDQARRLTLSVKRRRRGEPWKQLRPIPIEDWMAQEGLTAAEVIGDQFGNGTYKWELRNQGRYSRSGSCDLEGFDHVPDEKILNEDDFMAPVAEAPVIPVGEIVQGAVEAAMAPMAELVGSLRGDLTTILTAKLQAPTPPPPVPRIPQPDPALQTLIGILAQQNTALFELVGRSFTERTAPVPVTNVPPPKEDHFRSSLRNLKELVGIANELRSAGLPVPEMPGEFTGDEEDEEIDDLGDVLALTAPTAGEVAEKNNLFDRAGAQVSQSLERVLSSFLRYGEEKLQSEVMGAGVGAPQPDRASAPLSGATPAVPGLTPETVKELERLFSLVDQCVREGVTVEEFREHVLPRVPEEFLELMQTGKLHAGDLAELSKFLGKPEITRRMQEPEVREYLGELLNSLPVSEHDTREGLE